MKLEQMEFEELKSLEGLLYYLIDDNPELGDITVQKLYDIVSDKMEEKEDIGEE